MPQSFIFNTITIAAGSTSEISTSNPFQSTQTATTEESIMPQIRVVDGEIVIRNPTNFLAAPAMCTNYRCPRTGDCIRSIGNVNAVGNPTKGNKYISGISGCQYFLPWAAQYIEQLKERGVPKLSSAWRR